MTLVRTRRTFLAAASSSFLLTARGGGAPGEAVKIMDPATEFELIRVAAEKHNSWLPPGENRALTRKGDALIFASDRSGVPQLYRHEFKPNRIRQLTAAAKLDTNAFSLDSAGKHVQYFDGGRMMQVNGGGGREKRLFDLPAGATCFDTVEDTIVLAAGNRLFRGTELVAQAEAAISNLTLRPRSAGAAFLSGGALYYSALNGSAKKLAGSAICARWAPDGGTILYLAKTAALPEIREVNPDSGEEAFVVRTSQFGYFQCNGDASVFLGVSGSLAQPNLVLLLRTVKRELTVSEHRASSAAITRAAFSANSSRLVYQTDRTGKMAVYAMAVDKLVESTDEV
ncbi:MAG: hypothetical protein FJW30_07715 [Acidobacteria bacterium]|nr:hypothetical protein [Acidobacteriota bacterium]